VYADADRRARAAGWDAVGKDRDGRTSQWVKAYPDWSRGGLSLERLNPEKAAPPYSYSLIGSIQIPRQDLTTISPSNGVLNSTLQ
jgi:hypothetical protein